MFRFFQAETFSSPVGNFSLKAELCLFVPQVIEVFIRSEEGLSRDMVKHLNLIEEQVLDSKAWSADSALWSALQAAGNKVPTVEEVSRKHTNIQTFQQQSHKHWRNFPSFSFCCFLSLSLIYFLVVLLSVR